MKTRLIFLWCMAIMHIAVGQNSEKYAELRDTAFSLYEQQHYVQSAAMYKKAFDQFEGKAYPNDRYNAACSYARSGNTDTAFYHLFRLAKDSKYKDYRHITTDMDLEAIRKDRRWEELIDVVKKNKDEYEKDLDKPLVVLLDSIYVEDQQYRKQLDEIEEKFGRSSPEMQDHWKVINQKDSTNLIVVSKMLDERGWLAPSIVGDRGASTLFLVIQHADIETQKKYLPMMREAVKKGDAQGNQLALLEDRVALREGKKQIYGSQIGRDMETGAFYVLPLEDPENVDKRREEVGLSPLQIYTQNWNFDWDVERHKKKLSAIEALNNEHE